MNPRHTWIVTAACLALLCGAMAWTTHSMLGMEREQSRMAAEATVQEMARLALWRMESIARDLVIEESARPLEDFRTLAVPEAVLDNKTYATVKPGDLWTFSPVLREPPEYVLLHFEMDASGALRSPQVPVGNDLMVCQVAHFPPAQVIDGCGDQLNKLRGLLDLNATDSKLSALRANLPVPPQLTGNRAWLWDENKRAAPVSEQNRSNTPGATAQDKATDVQSNVQQSLRPAANYGQQSVAWKPEQAQAQQSEFNANEAQARAEFLESGKERAQTRRMINALNNDEINKKAISKNPAPAKPEAPKGEQVMAKEISPALLPSPAPVTSASSAVRDAAPAPAPPTPKAAMSEFRPFWMAGALILTRRVAAGDREWIQGAWLDWEKLRGELLAAVLDRFPNAQIVAAGENPAQGAHLLASLPVQLIPGAVGFAAQPFWTPLKVSLGIAWLCVLLAVAAVALVLRGMMALSERRASFVSSVTHELRTPLATFKLYSEMLADGMVKEETKKQQYLETLTGEADRLGHLVENVLAYSRIERGKGPAAASAVPVGDLLRRIEPRLNQRAMMTGMDFSVSAAPDVTAVALRTDAGAVEQILCNLVDNACKYGRRDESPGRVELEVTKERRRICFAVRDHGPGIARGEERELFLPFHKSAREAAHSKPGVGLGLALCRRLAVELRGSLEIDRSWRQGASFVLRLPV